MRMLYNPKKLGDKVQAWRCFLIGSLFTSSFIFFVTIGNVTTTGNVIAFFATLAMMAAAVLMFLDTNINFKKPTYLSQNILSAGIGLVIPLLFYLSGFLLVYLWIIIVLVLVTWLHKFQLREKIKKKSGTEEKTEK